MTSKAVQAHELAKMANALHAALGNLYHYEDALGVTQMALGKRLAEIERLTAELVQEESHRETNLAAVALGKGRS